MNESSRAYKRVVDMFVCATRLLTARVKHVWIAQTSECVCAPWLLTGRVKQVRSLSFALSLSHTHTLSRLGFWLRDLCMCDMTLDCTNQTCLTRAVKSLTRVYARLDSWRRDLCMCDMTLDCALVCATFHLTCCITLTRMAHTSKPAHCNALQHTATHCNALQHTATLCNTLQHSRQHVCWNMSKTCLLKHVKDFDRKNPPPPGGVSYLLCSLIKNRVQGPPSKDLYQVLRGGSSYTRFLMREHSK